MYSSSSSIVIFEIFITLIVLLIAGYIGWKLEQSHQSKMLDIIEEKIDDQSNDEINSIVKN
jgi:uncharacterized protein YacL